MSGQPVPKVFTKPSTLKARSRLKPQSAKRRAENEMDGPRGEVREATFRRDRYRCVARLFVPGVPCSAALECDEFQGRGREPGSHLDETATQTLCSRCHRVKTTEPRVAGLLGLYGPDEQLRRIGEEPPGVLTGALADFGKRKAQQAGVSGPAGGDAVAVTRFATDRGVTIPRGAWE